MWIFICLAAINLVWSYPTNDFEDRSKYNPPQNPSLYEVDTLAQAASVFPFGGVLPLERAHHVMDANSNFLFVHGGYSRNGTILGDLNLYHIPSQTWSNPISRLECCNEDNEVVETIGTQKTFQFPFMRPGFQGDFPLPRAEHDSCVINEELYIFGGVTNEYGYMNDIYKFNAQTLKWIILDNLGGGEIPRRRAGHTFLSNPATSECYLFGGRSNSSIGGDAVGLSDVWSFNTLTQSWKKLDLPNINSITRPNGRQHVASMVMNGDIYIFGGNDPLSGLFYQDLWVFYTNDQSFYWKQIQPAYPSNQMIHQYSPPALSHAHLLPSQCEDPIAFSNCQGILIYGGLGAGGFCGDRQCRPTELVLGQLYLYSFNLQSWLQPFANLAEEFLQLATQSNWLHARLSSAPFLSTNTPANQRMTQPIRNYFGKYIKTYAMEKIIFLSKQRIFYEFGGIQAINNTIILDEQENKLFLIQSMAKNQFDSSFPPSSDSLQSNIDDIIQPSFLDVGGNVQSSLSDVQIGEQLRIQLDLPANRFWDYRDAFLLPESGGIEYLRSLRKFSVGSTDVILLNEEISCPLSKSLTD